QELSGAELARIPVQFDQRSVEAMCRESRSECSIVDWFDVHLHSDTAQLILYQHGRALAGGRRGRNKQREPERDGAAMTRARAAREAPAGAVEQRRSRGGIEWCKLGWDGVQQRHRERSRS